MKKKKEVEATVGIKFDGEKNRYDLIPPFALDAVAEVLTYGAAKYSPDNWKKLEDAENRYWAAANRHMWAIRRGEDIDPESGMTHIAHAMCSMMYISELKHSPLS